ncbi:AraC family transcriptional regulator [Paraburkholderia bannensis]|uniref:AraC family transcriptional regulator n=2 Tax=Paraburkholderia bannensis TaxID=765414 RepID=UPI002AB5E435|nr:AraC family transcriptional regulator [Paraburkholderia bannensis]
MSTAIALGAYRELALDGIDRERVVAIWRYDATVSRSQLILPDGRMNLAAHCTTTSGSRLAAVWLALAGPADTWRYLTVRPGVVSIGVRFRIGWGGTCLGVPAALMRNQWIAGRRVATLLGKSAHSILFARSVEELQHGLVQAVARTASNAPVSLSHKRAIDTIDQAFGRKPRRIQLASRTLRHDVLAAAGIPLRSLAGILRFQQAMSLLHEGVLSLKDIASGLGYSDQSHMNREFRRFGGFAPSLRVSAPIVGAFT